jgi:hypothetical protein
MVLQHALQETEELYRRGAITVEPFRETLSKHGLHLNREQTTTLQISVGLLCNQTCRHCHLNAGPSRSENMDLETVDHVVSYAKRGGFEAIDITGGAPELNPNLVYLIESIAPFAPRIMVRSNLTALNDGKKAYLMDLFKAYRIVVVASFPSINEAQAESLRGQGIFQTTIATLKNLNAMGYGQEGTGLELNLVSNPTGAFLSTPVPLKDSCAAPLSPSPGMVIFMTVISISLGAFTWEGERFTFLKCPDLQRQAGLSLSRITVIHVPQVPDSPEVGLSRLEFRPGFQKKQIILYQS